MDAKQLRECRNRLENFLKDLLEPLGRATRRHWGNVYVRGLLLDGERKSIEPMADRMPDGNVQAMQQLIGQTGVSDFSSPLGNFMRKINKLTSYRRKTPLKDR